jgi:hypothetical protein
VMLMQPGTADTRFEHHFRQTRLLAVLFTALTLEALVISASLGFRSNIGEAEASESSILRTAVISLAAVLLAVFGRKERFAQAKALVIPWLLVGGAKLLVQDLPSGKPSVLFGSLAIFGAALIIVPRLLRVRA